MYMNMLKERHRKIFEIQIEFWLIKIEGYKVRLRKPGDLSLCLEYLL